MSTTQTTKSDKSPAALLGRASTRRPLLVCLSWLILILVGFAVGGQVTSRFDGTGINVTSSESYQAGQFLNAQDPTGDQITALVTGADVTTPTIRAQVLAAATAVRRIPGVASVSTPYPDGVSKDGEAVAVRISFPANHGDDAEDNAIDAAYARFHQISASSGVSDVYVSGGPLLNQQMNHGTKKALQLAEELSLPIILIGLFIVFGSFLAALLPLAVSLAGISSALLILLAFSHVTTLSEFALTITTMIGLGIGVDYSLLLISRFREERQGTWDRREAARRATARAGRTVLFSGLTVTISSLGLCFFDNSFLRSIGLATASVVLVDMLAALTLLPALLALFGVKAKPSHAPRSTGVFASIARLAARLRVALVIGVTALLVLLAIPLGGLHSSDGDASWLPKSTESRQEYEAAIAHFGSSSSNPVEAVVQGEGSQYAAFIAKIVTGAALLIAVVFACFMVGGNAVIGQIGLGLTLAVLLDATVVRMLLVPATMALLGQKAWWAPAPLRRLHSRYGLTETPDAAEPRETAAAGV